MIDQRLDQRLDRVAVDVQIDRGSVVVGRAHIRLFVAGKFRVHPQAVLDVVYAQFRGLPETDRDRKSTRLNSSHSQISYAVFCLKKKKKNKNSINDLEVYMLIDRLQIHVSR